MDQTLQELKRKWLQSPGDADVAGRYIAALERSMGGVQAAKKAPKRLGWACPDPEPFSADGERFCTKHDQWDSRCTPTKDDPCDYTFIGPAGLPGSPDGVCVYPGEVVEDITDGVEHAYVELLVDGNKVHHPVPIECKDEYWESCIFCGEPDERK